MTRSVRSRSRALRIGAALLAAPLALSPIFAPPAAAQWIVYDPTNYAQNVLTAARTLQQVNQQITQLQNEATMLINQARNLASLPYSSIQQLQQSVQRTQQLLAEAQGIALNVQQIDRAFQTTYGNASMSASDQALVAGARERWQNTVGGLQDAMRVQAGVVGNIDTNRGEMTALVGQSQGATGALQATQAGNQLLALQAQQLADLTAVVAANGRALSLEAPEGFVRVLARDDGPAQAGRAVVGHAARLDGQVALPVQRIVREGFEVRRALGRRPDEPAALAIGDQHLDVRIVGVVVQRVGDHAAHPHDHLEHTAQPDGHGVDGR